MLDPYTMQRLNAERLKDFDREAAGLCYSRLARHNRRIAIKAVQRRLADFLIAARYRINYLAGHRCRRAPCLLKNDPLKRS